MQRINFGIDELQAFLAVADKASFKAAAEQLFVTQPALSRRIDKLENVLGSRLFERTTRRVSLTEAGQQFLQHARAALEELEMAVHRISEQAAQRSGVVTVACVPSVASHWLPTVLKKFSAQFPGVRVRMIDESAGEVVRSVVSGVPDFGLNFIGAQEADIDFKAVYTESFLLAMQADHPLARRECVSWQEVAGERFISVSASSGNRALIDNALARVEKRPAIFYETNHVVAALGLVAAGLGVAAVPNLAFSKASHPTLAGVPLMDPAITRTLGLISRKGRRLQPAAQALYDMLENSMARRAAARTGAASGEAGC